MADGAIPIGEMVLAYWPVPAVSFLVSLLATPVCRSFAKRHGITDKPDAFLKPHQKPVPYLGGVAIFLGWAAGVVLAIILFGVTEMAEHESGETPVMYGRMMLGIVLAGLITMLLGLFDDLHVMTPRVKLLGNVAVAGVLIFSGLGEDIIRVITEIAQIELAPWLLWTYSVPITVFIVVGACNATNLIDGVDGLCSGVLGIISVGFLIIAGHLHIYGGWTPLNVQRVVLSLAMLGAASGFLPYNRNPATIFMGDAGSMLLGLNAAVLILLFAEGVYLIRWALAAVLVFGLPLVDMLLALARRWRAQKPLMQGDRSHFYDQLLDRGIPIKKVVAISYLLAAFYAAAGCASIVVRTRYSLLVYLLVGSMTLWAIRRYRMVRVDRGIPSTQ